jgi:hypothetical protein
MKAFFILDKWCAANKSWGPSAWETNFVSSFASLEKYEYSTFHFDEFHDQHPGENANKALIESLKKESPDFIFLVIYQKPGRQDTIISIDSLKKIQEQLHIPIVTIFGDLEHREQEEILEIVEPYMSLILYTALAPPGIRLKNPKVKYTWVPKAPNIFYRDEGVNKVQEITYFGSPKPHRMKLIKYLQSNSIPIVVGGGERQQNIPVSKYAQLMRESKISLSFSRAEFCHVINARAFEVLACDSMLLEQSGMETPKILIPFEDFIPFFSKKDCLEKIKYFLKNDSERRNISHNGYLKYKSFFTSDRFWSEIYYYLYSTKGTCRLEIGASTLTSTQYWSLSIQERVAPNFNAINYVGFHDFLVWYYKILERFMIEDRLYFIFRVFRKILIWPRIFIIRLGSYILGRFNEMRVKVGFVLGRGPNIHR